MAASPGSPLILSDHTPSGEAGARTDFIVLPPNRRGPTQRAHRKIVDDDGQPSIGREPFAGSCVHYPLEGAWRCRAPTEPEFLPHPP